LGNYASHAENLWQFELRSNTLCHLMIVRVKICGTTCLKDAMLAIEAGADALGFIFYQSSPRHITPDSAAEIIGKLPALVSKVGVFVNAPAQEVSSIAQLCGLDTLQFHGDESPEYCRQFKLKVIKAFRVRDEESLQAMPPFSQETWLLDTYVAGIVGGTGEQFNWSLARDAAKAGRPVILAGGLTALNVARAVREALPYGVDVASGVEQTPGMKDPGKLIDFVRAAKAMPDF
jgi:phosphoribosylanthranilate isomerase